MEAIIHALQIQRKTASRILRDWRLEKKDEEGRNKNSCREAAAIEKNKVDAEI